MNYADSGVDVDIEEKAAKILYAAAKETWINRQELLGEVIVPFDDFSGLRAVNVGKLPKDTLMNIGFDGVGTKAEFAELTGKYEYLGYDLMAMVCDDAVIRGGEPVLVGSILDVNTLGNNLNKLEVIRQLAKGYVKAAKKANVAIINGEIAQLGSRIQGSGKLAINWGASVVWFAKKSKLITGLEVKPGDSIIGLKEASLRSNGISLVRNVLESKLGKNWYLNNTNGFNLAESAIRPSTIYTPAILAMHGSWDKSSNVAIKAAANITGGGLPSKLGRALRPSGYGAQIDNPFNPPRLLSYVQELGQVTDTEAYRTWHMGQGMVVITDNPESVIKSARSNKLTAKVIGKVEKRPGIRIRSLGVYQKNIWLNFDL